MMWNNGKICLSVSWFTILVVLLASVLVLLGQGHTISDPRNVELTQGGSAGDSNYINFLRKVYTPWYEDGNTENNADHNIIKISARAFGDSFANTHYDDALHMWPTHLTTDPYVYATTGDNSAASPLNIDVAANEKMENEMMGEYFGRMPLDAPRYTDPRFGDIIRKAWKVTVSDSTPTGSTELADVAFTADERSKKARIIATYMKESLIYNVEKNEGTTVDATPFSNEDIDKYVKALKLEVGQKIILPNAIAGDVANMIKNVALSDDIKIVRDEALDDYVSHALINSHLKDFGTIMDSVDTADSTSDVYFEYLDQDGNQKYMQFSSFKNTANSLVPVCDSRGSGCTLCMDTTDGDEREQCRVNMNHILRIPSNADNTYFENCVHGSEGKLEKVVVSPRYAFLYNSLLEQDPSGIALKIQKKNKRESVKQMNMNLKVSEGKLVSYNDFNKDDKTDTTKLALYRYNAGIGHANVTNDYGACIEPSSLDSVSYMDSTYIFMQTCMDSDNKLRIFLFNPFIVTVGVLWFIYLGIFVIWIGIFMDNGKIWNADNTEEGFILRHATSRYGDLITKDIVGKWRGDSNPSMGTKTVAYIFDVLHYLLTWGLFFVAFVYILVIQVNIGLRCDRTVIPYSSEGKVAQNYLSHVAIPFFLVADGLYLLFYTGIVGYIMVKAYKSPTLAGATSAVYYAAMPTPQGV